MPKIKTETIKTFNCKKCNCEVTLDARYLTKRDVKGVCAKCSKHDVEWVD